MSVRKVYTPNNSDFVESDLVAIEKDVSKCVNKYLDQTLVEQFQTYMLETYTGCHSKYTWCFEKFSKKIKQRSENQSELNVDATCTTDKVSTFAPFFVFLINGALSEKNEQDAQLFVSMIKDDDQLKSEVLKVMCTKVEQPDLTAPQYLLENGNFSLALKEKVLSEVSLQGGHIYAPLFEDINGDTNPLFRLAQVVRNRGIFQIAEIHAR